MKKEKTACFSGHRDSRLPQSAEGIIRMREALFAQIEKAADGGIDTFIYGGCYGFDLYGASEVLRAIARGRKLTLVAAVPFRGQERLWSAENKRRYESILQRAGEKIILSESYSRGCYFVRNRFMVDNSSLLICYCDGGGGGSAYTLDYAKEKGLKIINLAKEDF